jgi:diguanylate cyclase (GGDEF)-like protein
MTTSLPVLVLLTVLSTVAVILLAERAVRMRSAARDSGQQRQQRRQQVALLEELNEVKQELFRKRDLAELLPTIAKNLTEFLDAGSIAPIAVRSAKELFHATQVGFFTQASHSPDYALEVGVGFPESAQRGMRVHCDEGLLGSALRIRGVVSRLDPDASAGVRSSARSLEQAGVEPDFAAPIFGGTGVAGVLVIGGCPFPLAEEKKYVSMLADLVSLAVQKANLADARHTAAWKDDLTGVSKRLHFLNRLEGELRRTKNYEQPFALFMFDIDYFKTVNDSFGHAAGDVVIKKVAEIAMLNTRSSDLVGRYGGDEFLVLITAASREQAFHYCENLRCRIAATAFKIPELPEPLQLTISGGLALFPTHGHSTTDLLRAADHALYEAKRNGRNQTVLARAESLAGLAPQENDDAGVAPDPAPAKS